MWDSKGAVSRGGVPAASRHWESFETSNRKSSGTCSSSSSPQADSPTHQPTRSPNLKRDRGPPDSDGTGRVVTGLRSMSLRVGAELRGHRSARRRRRRFGPRDLSRDGWGNLCPRATPSRVSARAEAACQRSRGPPRLRPMRIACRRAPRRDAEARRGLLAKDSTAACGNPRSEFC